MSILSWLVMCPVRLSCLCDKIWGKQFNEGKLHHAPSGRGFIHPGWGGYSPVSCLVVEAERAGSKERDLGSNAAHLGSLSHLLCSDRCHLKKVPVLLLLQECHQLKSKTLIPKPLWVIAHAIEKPKHHLCIIAFIHKKVKVLNLLKSETTTCFIILVLALVRAWQINIP